MNSREKAVDIVSVNLTTDTGYNIFRDLNFTLFAGETAIISGSAGSGKTYLSELIIGGQRPNSGSVNIFGQNIYSAGEGQKAAIRRRIGGVGGIFDLLPFDTVEINLQYPLILRGASRKARKMKSEQIMAQLNISALRSRKVTSLTRGERLKVLLARAIIADQPLLLIDEPLDRMGPAAATDINTVLKRLSVSGYTMLILTTEQEKPSIPQAREFRLYEGRLL
ncbi:putative Lipoprotein-releasing system ATP-binding protein LolD [Candidatus Zixiibacteriota bacterium]|nr:putative Lipoprotein-releasing system ATP-binding protein LolD [candidate division Zixibacteria bacterium]